MGFALKRLRNTWAQRLLLVLCTDQTTSVFGTPREKGEEACTLHFCHTTKPPPPPPFTVKKNENKAARHPQGSA